MPSVFVCACLSVSHLGVPHFVVCADADFCFHEIFLVYRALGAARSPFSPTPLTVGLID